MHMTRRFFLKTSGAMAVYCGVAPMQSLGGAAHAVQNAAGTTTTAGKTLVVIFLRGGIDGLSLIVPHGDPAYNDLRRSLRIPRPGQEDGALDLDGYFSLNPRASALMPLFDQRLAVAAQAVGYEHNTRSHFEEQDRWETGVIGNTIGADGWLNRHLLTSQGHGPVRAISLGSTLPRILRGDAAAYAVRGLDDLGLPLPDAGGADVAAALEHAYADDARGQRSHARELVHQAGRSTLEGIRVIQQVAAEDYTPAAQYPDSGLGRQLRTAARLIKANIGLEVLEVDYGGWDTHNNQGSGVQGNYNNKVQQLADALAAFAADLGERLDDTLVLTLSDFGRTARENGTRGTDHGWANAMMAIGGPVAAAPNGTNNARPQTNLNQRRPVLTDWPGLGADQLWQNRDLRHTIDFRDVLAEVVGSHLGNNNLSRVLPDREFRPVGLIA
jgi:uncharacterized protein (DUF1501 family)